MAEALNETFPLLDAATACPVCAAPRPQPLHVYANKKRRIAPSGRLILTGCRACGATWAHPLPAEADLERWYAGDDGWDARPGLKAHAEGELEAMARKLEAKRPQRERETDLLLPLLGELAVRPPSEPPPSVLDFGCGIGAWLDAFAARGWATTGIEPGPTARAVAAQRHRVLDVPPSEPEFDLAVVQHVLEHLRDPRAAVRSVAGSLRPGGWCFVSVPSFDKLPVHGRFGYVSSGVHLFSYTAEAMRRMLALAGLQVEQIVEGGGWEEGSQGADVHLKVLARRVADVAPETGGDPLAPARRALAGWGAQRRAEIDAEPAPERPRGLARLSRKRQAAFQKAAVKHKRRLREPLDMPLLDAPPACPCCGGPDLRPLHVQRNPRRRIAAAPHLVLTGCERCGIVFAHPLPTPAELDAYYSGDGAGWEDRLEEDDGSQSTLIARKHATYERQLTLLGDHLDGAAGRGRRVLDVGCGLGAWLDVLNAHGWETEGIEPGSAQRAVAARRHRILDAIPAEPAYDLVVLNQVLEHLRDPVGMLRELRACVRPGGRLFASSPDLGRLHEHGKLSYVTSGVHIMSFTASGLASVLGLAGWHAGPALGGPDWDASTARPGMRLRMVATAGDPLEPSGAPLEPAARALREYAASWAPAADPPAAEKRVRGTSSSAPT